VHVLVRTLVGVSVERLRVLALPRGDLVGIDPHGAILHPGGELVQPLGVVVLADAGAELEVPLVHAADQVLALNGAVGQQRSPVQATAVQHRDLVIVTDDDEVHVPHQGEGRCAVLERVPLGDSLFLHVSPQLRLRSRGSMPRTDTGAI
jgi:hypothetical protein